MCFGQRGRRAGGMVWKASLKAAKFQKKQNSIKKTPLKTFFFYCPENLEKKASLIFYYN